MPSNFLIPYALSPARLRNTLKVTEDVVKVEIWDVVDKGKKKKSSQELKITENVPTDPSDFVLDAEFLDVYKGKWRSCLFHF